MSVYGHRCLGPKGLGHGCLGKMHYEYTEKMMYNQLLYFSTLFDVEKAKKISSATDRGKKTQAIVDKSQANTSQNA